MYFVCAKMNLIQKKLEDYLKGQTGDSEFNDGGSSNWARNLAIGFAIGAILFALVQVFMPQIVDAWKAKILSWF